MSLPYPPSRSNTLTISSPSVPSRNNPISLRIYKALGTTFDDPGSREALEIAASFYAPTSATIVEADRKGKGKALPESASDEPARNGEDVTVNGDVKLRSDEWEEVPRRTLKGQSAATARKYLKRDVETKLAASSQRFLEAFGEVDQVLRRHMEEMQVRCDHVQSELDQANSGTKYLLERADGLRSQREHAQLRSKIIRQFLARFTLSPAELASLTSRDVEVGKGMFDALDRVTAIRRDCRILLGGEEGKEQAGLDIMKATSEQMEAGYKKIYRWCQFEFRQYTREGQLDVSPVLREAVRRLRERPAMFRDAIQILTSTRTSSLLQSFLDALTRGGPNGLPRPIEIHAHDPIRYVGDMLAWLHQATASEHEFLESLFGVKERKRMVGQPRVQGTAPRHTGNVEVKASVEISDQAGRESVEDQEKRVRDEAEDAEGLVRECLDKDLDGLGRPLKTIKSQEGIIMAYKISNLLQFYLVTMKRTIGEEALLCKALQELPLAQLPFFENVKADHGRIYGMSYAAFLETLEAQGRSLLRFLHPPDATLTPPLALRDAAQVLREIITVYETSLVDASDREKDFETILEKAVDPSVEMCERMAEMRRLQGQGGKEGGKDGEWERDIFLINCLGYLLHSLEGYSFTAQRVASLEGQIGRHVESMTYEHHGRLLEQCGLAPIMLTIRNRPADTPLSRLPATDSKAITTALTQFSGFLSQLEVLSSPRLALLSAGNLGETIHRTALRRISEAYGEVCDRILDKKEGYEFGETLLRRGKEEVAVALGVEEDVGGERNHMGLDLGM